VWVRATGEKYTVDPFDAAEIGMTVYLTPPQEGQERASLTSQPVPQGVKLKLTDIRKRWLPARLLVLDLPTGKS